MFVFTVGQSITDKDEPKVGGSGTFMYMNAHVLTIWANGELVVLSPILAK